MTENWSLMTGPLEAEDDFNLTIIRTASSVLLGRKVRGFGSGRLVVPGGKTRYYIRDAGIVLVPPGQEAAREATEETGLHIKCSQLAQKGMLHIADEDDTRTVRLYEANLSSALAVTSTELSDLTWHPAAELPYDEMPDDYRLWLPHMLAGYAVNAFIETDSGLIAGARMFRQKLDPLGRMEEVVLNLQTDNYSNSTPFTN